MPRHLLLHLGIHVRDYVATALVGDVDGRAEALDEYLPCLEGRVPRNLPRGLARLAMRYFGHGREPLVVRVGAVKAVEVLRLPELEGSDGGLFVELDAESRPRRHGKAGAVDLRLDREHLRAED